MLSTAEVGEESAPPPPLPPPAAGEPAGRLETGTGGDGDADARACVLPRALRFSIDVEPLNDISQTEIRPIHTRVACDEGLVSGPTVGAGQRAGDENDDAHKYKFCFPLGRWLSGAPIKRVRVRYPGDKQFGKNTRNVCEGLGSHNRSRPTCDIILVAATNSRGGERSRREEEEEEEGAG